MVAHICGSSSWEAADVRAHICNASLWDAAGEPTLGRLQVYWLTSVMSAFGRLQVC